MADEASDRTIYLFRENVQIEYNGAIGERGYLVAGNAVYYTIERRGGYVVVPKGEYEIKMETSPTKGSRRQFRIRGHGVTNDRGSLAAFLIHSANFPDEIVGCIAPGKTLLGKGVGNSNKAMEEIFTFCGGFGVGKTATLVVDSL